MPKRRQFTPEFKAKVVLETLSGQKTAADICREHNLKPDLVSKWKAQFLAEAAKVFRRDEPADPQRPASPSWSAWRGNSASNSRWQKKPGRSRTHARPEARAE